MKTKGIYGNDRGEITGLHRLARGTTKAALAMSLALIAPETVGQGTIVFANRVITRGIDAPVMLVANWQDPVPLTAPADSRFLAQLFVNGAPFGQPARFLDGADAGYVMPHEVTVPGVSPGTTVQVTMLAWASELGGSYAEALAQGIGGTAASGSFQLTLSSAPSEAVFLVGLHGFNIWVPAHMIPEPGSVALITSGLAAVWLRCRRRSL